MTTLDQIADEVLLDLTSYGLSQPRLTSLATALTDTTTTDVVVSSATNIPVGLVEIDSELMYVQSVNTTSNTLTVIRGYRTTAATHAAGALVTVAPPWPRQQVVNAINDAITSAYPTLFKVAALVTTANTIDVTYALPGADKVLTVSSKDLTTEEYLRVKKFRLDPELGKLFIYDGLIPNSTIRIVYYTSPTPLASGSAELTTSGLQATAKAYIVLAAAAKLVMHMDGSRLAGNSAAADDMEANRSVGSATQIAKTLLAASELELSKEQARQRQKYPASISNSKGIR